MSHDPDRPVVSQEDARFIERLAQALPRPELSPARRAAFHARLDERRRRGAVAAWRPGWLALGAASAALALWLALPGAPVPEPVREAQAADAEAILALATEEPRDRSEALPADYQAIEDLWMGG
jgi:hypothetical protein